MIFYFSGTGNSKWIAEELAKSLNDKAIFIPDADVHYSLAENEVIGFVFPIYAWAPPLCVLKFIEKVQFSNFQNNFCFFTATCHTQTGNIDGIMKKALARRNIKCCAGFSVNMPNNYLLAPFIKTDSAPKRQKLLQNAQKKLENIVLSVSKREEIFNLTRGSRLLSFIAPLFQKFMTAKGFKVEKEKCIKCGKCAQVCPVKNILLSPYPCWGKRCEMCQACLHHCPTQAIQYGHFSKGKKRYIFNKDYLSHD